MLSSHEDLKYQGLSGGILLSSEVHQNRWEPHWTVLSSFVGPAELLRYPGSLASSSYAPFITYFQWPPPSRLQLEGQVGCRVVHNVWGISNQRSAEARALRPSPPFTPSRGGELQQWPRSTSQARQEVAGKEPWEPAACSALIAG